MPIFPNYITKVEMREVLGPIFFEECFEEAKQVRVKHLAEHTMGENEPPPDLVLAVAIMKTRDRVKDIELGYSSDL